MLYSQPLATRFGTDLKANLASPDWRALDIAVAWVRAPGVAHIHAELSQFVRAGKRLRVTAGLDLENTTKEGLEGLLSLVPLGAVELFVHHNEAAGVFHPKLYLFTNQTRARLIVGSNNLTQAGLFQNTEVGLSVDLPIGDPVIQSAQNALTAWADQSTGLAKPLDANLLRDLVAEGYVRDEATARAAQRQQAAAFARPQRRRLFGSIPVTVPPIPGGVPAQAPAQVARAAGHQRAAQPQAAYAPPPAAAAAGAAAQVAGPVGSVLLMRVRKAHVRDRPTQTQIPIAVRNAFFAGMRSVTSTHNGQVHDVIEAEARGAINTLKLELPEIRNFADPVVRFERTANAIVYETYDRATAQGQAIMTSLEQGRTTNPQSTFLSIADANRATWWRFV